MPAISRRRSRPSPLHVEPSTTSRSVPSSRSRAAPETNGGSPGHQTVTGRSWMMSGVTSAARWRPASPPAVRWMVSAQISGASARGSTQCASTRASIHDGPSGSADWTTTVRDGWRPGERLDDRGAALGDLLPSGDDHQVHHARSRRDVAFCDAVHIGREVLAGPDPGELLLDRRDAVRPSRPAQDRLVDGQRRRGRDAHRVTVTAAASADPPGSASRRPRPDPTSPAS